MQEQEYFQKCLSRKFMERRSRNPEYSLRAFSRDLNQNPAALSQILKGTRRVSKKFALEVCQRLGLTPSEMQHLETLFSAKTELSRAGASASFTEGRRVVDEAMYDLISDWRYYAILSLAESSNFEANHNWIAERLGITPLAAKSIVEKLIDLKLLRELENGLFEHAGSNVSSTDDITNLALRRRHESNLEDGKSALYRYEVEDRDFTFMTMCVDPSRLPGAKKMVREFMNRLCGYLEQGEKVEVYEICMQLFPRTNLIKKTDLQTTSSRQQRPVESKKSSSKEKENL